MLTNRSFLRLLTIIFIFPASEILAQSNKLPQLGVCAVMSQATQLKKYGYTFIQPTVSELLQPQKPDSSFRLGIKGKKQAIQVAACNVFFPGSIKTTGPDVNEGVILRYAETVFKRAHSLGIPIIVFGSGASRRIPEGFSTDAAFAQFVTIGKKLAMLAAQYHIILALESQNKEECNFLNTVEACIKVAKAVNHPNYKICVDIYHMMRENEPADILLSGGSLVYHCDIGEKATRSAPGVAGDDFTPYFRVLQKIGYTGKIALECRFTNPDIELPLARKTLRHQWIEASKQL